MALPSMRYLNSLNGYLPELTGQVIAFVSTPEEFSVNSYVQYVMSENENAAYQEIARDEFVRVQNIDQDVWAPGAKRPDPDQSKLAHRMIPFRTQQRSRGSPVSYREIEQAVNWKPKEAYSRKDVMQTKTAETQRVMTLLENPANWVGSSASANTLNGGFGGWKNASADPNSPNYLAIFKTLVQVSIIINLNTNKMVKGSDLVFIIDPNSAAMIAQTPELQDYVKQSYSSYEILKDGFDPQFEMFGVPRRYRSFRFQVEDAPIVTSNALESAADVPNLTAPADQTQARHFIKAPSTCLCVSRPGKLEGTMGGPNFSTVQIYYYRKRMEVKGFNDEKNELWEQFVSLNQVEVLAAPISGFQITGINT